jgi:hypothetical protein
MGTLSRTTQTNYGEYAAESGVPAAFAAVEARVLAGTLRCFLIGGVARGGTTASEKVLYESLGFDGNFNQPGLLARDKEALQGVDRLTIIWNRILAKVPLPSPTLCWVWRDLLPS